MANARETAVTDLKAMSASLAAAGRLGIKGVLVGSDINAAIMELNALLEPA